MSPLLILFPNIWYIGADSMQNRRFCRVFKLLGCAGGDICRASFNDKNTFRIILNIHMDSSVQCVNPTDSHPFV